MAKALMPVGKIFLGFELEAESLGEGAVIPHLSFFQNEIFGIVPRASRYIYRTDTESKM